MNTLELTVGLTLTREGVKANLNVLGDLPSLSPVVAQLTATLGRDDVGVTQVEAIIHRDPVIAAKILFAANAAAFASHTPTTSVRAALMRLGFLRVRRLALLISLYNAVPPAQHTLQEAFWRHSLAVAHAAEVIGRHAMTRKPDADVESVFLAGLMHDIGVLVLSSHYAQQYAAVSAHAGEHGLTLPAAEMSVLALDHGEIGACLAEHWQFPPDTAAAIRFHHRVEEAPKEHRWEAAVIRLADAASSMDSSWDLGEGSTLSEEEPWLEDLGLKADALPEILEETRVEATRATAVLAEAG